MPKPSPLTRHETILGEKYRLGPEIGSGGVATVYRARHIWTEREVAVKVLNPGLPHFERLREGFLREARATVQLEHPNVVEVLDMGEDDHDTAYMVMELLEGPTLRDVLLERGRLSQTETVAILLPLIDALENAHGLGIVHRDFKPENVMLSVDAYGLATPKLLDFGVAEILQDRRSQNLKTRSDVIMGTPQYMSPEQARDQRALIGFHTDVWGVGVVCYECLTGYAPFDGDSATDILHAVCEAEIDFAEVPDAFAPLLQRALTRSVAGRTRSLSGFKTQLAQIGFAMPSTPPPEQRVSSLPAPPAAERELHRTLAGLGPKPLSLPLRAEAPVDSEPLGLPQKSNRGSTLVGLTLVAALGLAAWWAIRGPSPTQSIVPLPPAPAMPAAAAEALPISPPPEAALPAASAAATPLPEPEPTVEVLEEAPDETAEAKAEPPPPTEPRRGSASPRRRSAPPSTSPQYDKPPDLVSEW